MRLPGASMAAWRWGTAHRARFRHQPFGRLPILGPLTDIEIATDGGPETVNRGETSASAAEPFLHLHGAGFRAIYDLDDRYQVPGAQYLWTGRTYERDGVEARWRGVYDDKGRLMVALNHNMDLGDAWEWSDDPRYPEKWASLAYRIGVNYVMYSMTH